jgi:putative PIN family toxin of toxin-antitoxin system
MNGIIGNTMNKPPKIVMDTNVLVAGLRSRNGASFQLLSRLTSSQFELYLTVPLAMEYEDVLHRPGLLPLPTDAIDAVLDMVCAVAFKQDVHFLWRPQLCDPNDELVLEAAVNASADFLITHNLRDFAASGRFALRVVTPGQFLKRLDGETP